ncbi:hypothetical protein BDP27DRAFT_1433327 [Rhodocollybia butyracea]|uniref:Uncharacterized protein n=1 Tax=Rhodocollybia butyracea TaxID=206335 RepID=A0A9P5P7W9_9AGAR|nr:hypothetical protein BDP27DRAFT_1433327 [Rhodocollybia butyracea]
MFVLWPVALMSTIFSESSLFSAQVAIVGPIIVFALVLALFGFYTLLFGLSVHFLYKGKNIPHRNLHIAWIISLFLITSVGGIISAATGIDDLVVIYNTLRTQDLAAFVKFFNANTAETVMTGFVYTCLVLANCIADSVMIHRIYLVWGSRLWIIILPALASLVLNVVGLTSDIMRTKGFSNAAIESNFDLELKGKNIGLGFFYANAVFNMLLTAMIAGRIWWVGRRTSATFGRSGMINQKYKDLIAVLLECGVLYPIALIAHAAVEGHLSTIAIPVDMTGPTILVAGISPTMIIFTTIAPSTLQYSSQGGMDSTKNIANLMRAANISQGESTLNSGQNLEVEIEMKRITVEV